MRGSKSRVALLVEHEGSVGVHAMLAQLFGPQRQDLLCQRGVFPLDVPDDVHPRRGGFGRLEERCAHPVPAFDASAVRKGKGWMGDWNDGERRGGNVPAGFATELAIADVVHRGDVHHVQLLLLPRRRGVSHRG